MVLIRGLKRRLGKPVEEDWSADMEFQPDAVETPQSSTDLTTHFASPRISQETPSNEVNMTDYYKAMIQTAINQGGTYRGQLISVPWLRMILAGLEMRPISPEMMWQGEESESTGISSYEDFFQPQPVLASGSGAA